MSKTNNYGLDKQLGTEVYSYQKHNDNYDKIDKWVVAWGGTTTSVGNVYSIADPVIESLNIGMAISFIVNADSTGAASLNWAGTGAKPILKAGGGAVTNLKAGGIYTVRYGGTAFMLQGEGGEYGTASPAEVLTGFTIGTESGVVNGTLALTGDAVAANVLNGKTFYNTNAKTKVTGTIPSKTAQTYTPSTVDQTIAANQFLSGAQTIKGDADLIAANIKSGVDIFGVVGTNKGNVAEGMIRSDYSGGTVTVTGLAFTPKKITLHTVTSLYHAIYDDRISTTQYTENSTSRAVSFNGGYIVSNGFKLYTGASNIDHYWHAEG